MKALIIVSLTLMITVAGCRSISTTSPSKLPLMGTAPLSNTIYKGSDSEFHYFSVNKGVRSREYRIPRDEASVSPEVNELNQKGKFIKEIKGSEIQLLILENTYESNLKMESQPVR